MVDVVVCVDYNSIALATWQVAISTFDVELQTCVEVCDSGLPVATLDAPVVVVRQQALKSSPVG